MDTFLIIYKSISHLGRRKTRTPIVDDSDCDAIDKRVIVNLPGNRTSSLDGPIKTLVNGD